jgi:hypothetical protein
MSTSEIDDLRAEVDRLRTENDTLRTVPADSAPAKRRAPGRWRAFLSALVIVIATLLVPLSIVAAWARVQLVDEEAFVATMAPLAQDPAVQQLVIDESMDAINAQVDFQELTSSVFDGIAQLDLPPRAQAALGLLEAPAAAGLENLVTTTVTRVVESDAFADVWATATRAAHRGLTAAATSDGGGVVVMSEDGVGIQLGTIVEQVKQNLIDRGVGAAQVIPTVDKVIIIGTGTALVTIRTVYAIAATLGWWLPVISLALFGLGILIARRRSVAVLGSGIGLAIGGSVLALGFAIGYPIMGQAAVQLDLSVAALDVIYGALVGSMAQTAQIVALLGVFIAVLGWFMGRSAAAERSRGFVGGVNASARRGFAERGLDTGSFGLALARYRMLGRIVIAIAAVLWLYALRPLSFGDLLLVIVVAFAFAWLLELLQKRPEEVGGLTAEGGIPEYGFPEEAAPEAAVAAEVAAEDAELAAQDAERAAADAEAAAALVGATVIQTTDAPAPGSEEAAAEAPVKNPRAPRL